MENLGEAINDRRLETELIGNCAPTLAGLKSANLFRYRYRDADMVLAELSEVNRLLNERGVYVEALCWEPNAVLVYAYRRSHLERELQGEQAREILNRYGYPLGELEGSLAFLKKRLKGYTCFPHEIGIFLGYPPEDVKGFIENRGKNCQYCGLWKVYGNAQERRKLFCKLQKCSEVYLRVFAEGRELTQMTVCA
jgi:hypothetical protein